MRVDRRQRVGTLLCVSAAVSACGDGRSRPDLTEPWPVHATASAAATPIVGDGRRIFRYDDFGDWRFWPDTLRLHELIEQVTPRTALQLGLKVDADAVPGPVLDAVLSNPALLDDPATTLALLSLDAVLGVRREWRQVGSRGSGSPAHCATRRWMTRWRRALVTGVTAGPTRIWRSGRSSRWRPGLRMS